MAVTYTPPPPWTDGQAVVRDSDGTRFVYSISLNTLSVDSNIAGVNKDANGFMVKNLPAPVNNADAANKQYVDTHGSGTGGGIPEAPTDGGTYARESSAWTKTWDGGAY